MHLVRFWQIVLQKSKVASVRIFGETLKSEAIDDSYNLSRVTEVAHEFSVGRQGPSDLYAKTAPAALRIFDTTGKTTFATLSRVKRTSHLRSPRSETDPAELAAGPPVLWTAYGGNLTTQRLRSAAG
jgi:hypothetical protein